MQLSFFHKGFMKTTIFKYSNDFNFQNLFIDLSEKRFTDINKIDICKANAKIFFCSI